MAAEPHFWTHPADGHGAQIVAAQGAGIMTHIADKCMERQCPEPGGKRLLCDRHARQYDGMEPFDLDAANDAFAEFVAPFVDDVDPASREG
jgi:hypothetical protein